MMSNKTGQREYANLFLLEVCTTSLVLDLNFSFQQCHLHHFIKLLESLNHIWQLDEKRPRYSSLNLVSCDNYKQCTN